jgi:tetratricopeptide (TPR) repeat protein
VLRDLGDLEGARAEYEEALAHNPRYVPARVLLGITLFTLGRRPEAEQQWEKVLETDPQNKSAQMYLRMVRANALRPSAPSPTKTREED